MHTGGGGCCYCTSDSDELRYLCYTCHSYINKYTGSSLWNHRRSRIRPIDRSWLAYLLGYYIHGYWWDIDRVGRSDGRTDGRPAYRVGWPPIIITPHHYSIKVLCCTGKTWLNWTGLIDHDRNEDQFFIARMLCGDRSVARTIKKVIYCHSRVVYVGKL